MAVFIGLAATLIAACALRPLLALGEGLNLSGAEWLIASGLGLLCAGAAAWHMVKGGQIQHETDAFLEAAASDA